MVRPVRLELTAPRLKGGCSTTELRARKTVKYLLGLIVQVKPDLIIISILRSAHKYFLKKFLTAHGTVFFCDDLL